MPLGRNDAQTTQCLDLLVVLAPQGPQRGNLLLLLGCPAVVFDLPALDFDFAVLGVLEALRGRLPVVLPFEAVTRLDVLAPTFLRAEGGARCGATVLLP